MRTHSFQRAGLKAALTLAAAFSRPLEADGLVMDRTMSAFVRFANRMGRAGQVPSLAGLRQRYAAAPGLVGLAPDPRVRVCDTVAGGRPARRYEPPGPVAADMLFFHGGGFIMGGLGTHDALCRHLAAQAGLRVTAVDYRLAPEHPFPAAAEDAAAAWRWALESGSGPWLLGGDSAGANLAAVLALDGRARLQVLFYPVVDMLHQDGLYPSIVTFGEGFLLTGEGLQQCAQLLLPPDQDRADPRLSPIRAELGRASPALVVVAGFDPLRDQGVAYAAALEKAGVAAHLLAEPTLPHGFADFAGVVDEARRAVDRVADAIRAALSGANRAGTGGS